MVCLESRICTHSTRTATMGMAVQSVRHDGDARDRTSRKSTAGSERVRMISKCIMLVTQVWNPYGSQDVEITGGVGAYRDKWGEVKESSLLSTDAWEFKVGFRPPIWCYVDEEGNVTLNKYSAQWERMNSTFEAPTENNP